MTPCSIVGRFGGTCCLNHPFFYSPLFLFTCPIVFFDSGSSFLPLYIPKIFLSLFLLDTFLLPRPFSRLILPRLLLVAASHWFTFGTRSFFPFRIFYPYFCCMTYFSTLKMGAANFSEKTVNLHHVTRCHIVSFLQAASR